MKEGIKENIIILEKIKENITTYINKADKKFNITSRSLPSSISGR